MAGGVAFSNLGDLVNHTLPKFKNKGAFESAFEYQRFVACDQWFRNDKIEFQDGNSIESRVILESDGSAKYVDQFEKNDEENYIDLASKMSAPWVRLTGKATWEEVEASMRRGPSALIDYIKSRFYVGVKDLLLKIEERAFSVPQDASDSKGPRGLRYWLSYLNSGTTDYTGGFNCYTVTFGDGSTTTTKGGIDGAAQRHWRNWGANHNGLNMQTLDTIARGLMYTDFVPPRDLREYYNPKKQTRRIYSSIAQQAEYERLINQTPDNKNGDLRRFRGQNGILDFRGVEWMGVKHLEDMSYEPIFVPSMPNFFPFIHSEWWMKRSKALNSRTQHTVWTTFFDCLFNFACDNIRNQMVLHRPF